MAGDAEKLTVMVSSTVRDIPFLLDQVEASLRAFGYHPWISAKGTIPVNPDLSNFENCLNAVENCDVFFGIITTAYGSGRETPDGLSITHREILRAIELKKPRWIVCHETIMTARTLLNDLSYRKKSFKGAEGRAGLTLRKGASLIKDLKVIDMFEAASLEGVPVATRKGNWVQPFANDKDVLTYLDTQFRSEPAMRRMLEQRARDAAQGAPVPRRKRKKTAKRAKTKTTRAGKGRAR